MHDRSNRRQLFRGCLCCNQPAAPPLAMHRRKFLTGLAAVGLAGTGLTARATTGRRLIDLHNHVIPPFYLAENRDRIDVSLSRALLDWTPQQSIDAMDQHGVETAVLSLSTPGVWFGNAETARSTARRVNEYCVELAGKHPGRFGLFGAIPLPDIEGSLREIGYALDVLKADGIGLLTSYGGKWLGDADYQPVLDELNRRKAVVFVHPTIPSCCRTLMPGTSPIIAEVPQDTTRTVMSLLFSGTLTRCKDIRFIFCHAGGSVPMVASRMTQYGPKDLTERLPQGVDHELKRLYYDIAVGGNRPAIAALASLIPVHQILFGSDFPYRPLGESADGMSQLGLSEADQYAIGRDNALALLPRLKAG